jgi:hypothetical protein
MGGGRADEDAGSDYGSLFRLPPHRRDELRHEIPRPAEVCRVRRSWETTGVIFRNKHGLSWASVLVGLGLRRFVYWAASVNLAETWIFFIFLYLPFYKFTKIYTPRDILQNYKYTVVRNRTVVSTRVVGRVPGHIYV